MLQDLETGIGHVGSPHDSQVAFPLFEQILSKEDGCSVSETMDKEVEIEALSITDLRESPLLRGSRLCQFFLNAN